MFFGYPNKNLVSIVESIHPYLNLSDAERDKIEYIEIIYQMILLKVSYYS